VPFARAQIVTISTGLPSKTSGSGVSGLRRQLCSHLSRRPRPMAAVFTPGHLVVVGLPVCLFSVPCSGTAILLSGGTDTSGDGTSHGCEQMAHSTMYVIHPNDTRQRRPRKAAEVMPSAPEASPCNVMAA
jgi:hypothetical protein